MAQVTHTDTAVLNFPFAAKLGSRWGISGRRVGEPGRKSTVGIWCFPRSLNTKEGWRGILPRRLFSL